MMDPNDPVLARRRQLARWSSTGKRAGYGLYGLSLAAFAVGLATGFTTAPATVATVALLVGSVAAVALDHHRLRREGQPTGPTGPTTGSPSLSEQQLLDSWLRVIPAPYIERAVATRS